MYIIKVKATSIYKYIYQQLKLFVFKKTINEEGQEFYQIGLSHVNPLQEKEVAGLSFPETFKIAMRSLLIASSDRIGIYTCKKSIL